MTNSDTVADFAKRLQDALCFVSLFFSRANSEDYKAETSREKWGTFLDSVESLVESPLFPKNTICSLHDVSKKLAPYTAFPSEQQYRHFCNKVLTTGFASTAMPVESLYKAWGSSRQLTFSREKGCFDGDSAAHMRYLYEGEGIEIPTRFKAMPDHLSLLLDYYSLMLSDIFPDDRSEDAHSLTHNCRQTHVDFALQRISHLVQFSADHLDWIPLYLETLQEVSPAFQGDSSDAFEFAQVLLLLAQDCTQFATLVQTNYQNMPISH